MLASQRVDPETSVPDSYHKLGDGLHRLAHRADASCPGWTEKTGMHRLVGGTARARDAADRLEEGEDGRIMDVVEGNGSEN